MMGLLLVELGRAVGGAGLGGAGRMQLNQDLCFVFLVASFWGHTTWFVGYP